MSISSHYLQQLHRKMVNENLTHTWYESRNEGADIITLEEVRRLLGFDDFEDSFEDIAV